jgi:hypothetical protein
VLDDDGNLIIAPADPETEETGERYLPDRTRVTGEKWTRMTR